MITPELKDKLLQYIVNTAVDMVYKGSEEQLASEMDTTTAEIEAILDQFNKHGLIQPSPYQTEEDLTLSVKAYAHDYILKGGHVGEFRVLELQLRKMENEILALEKQFGKEKLRDLLSISTAISSFLQSFYRP